MQWKTPWSRSFTCQIILHGLRRCNAPTYDRNRLTLLITSVIHSSLHFLPHLFLKCSSHQSFRDSSYWLWCFKVDGVVLFRLKRWERRLESNSNIKEQLTTSFVVAGILFVKIVPSNWYRYSLWKCVIERNLQSKDIHVGSRTDQKGKVDRRAWFQFDDRRSGH